MSFIHPFFLYLLPLAALPIVIHLIGRQRYARQEFSTLRFLRQLEIDLIRKLKIRQILLLILRILLIAALILSLARPYRSSRSPGIFVGRGETLYLIVDNSLSMQIQSKGQSVLEAVKSDVVTATGQIDFPIHLKIVETTRPNQINDAGLITSPADIAAILAAVDVTNCHGKIETALRSVRTELDSRQELNPAVWILSDFQKTGFRALQPFAEFMAKTDARIILFAADGEKENVGLSSIFLPGQLFRLNQPAQVQGHITNWSPVSREVPVALFLDEQKLGQALALVEPFGEATVRFEFLPFAPGFQRARLEIADDHLIPDNQRYFNVHVPAQIEVLIVSRSPSDSRFIKRALEADASAGIRTRLASVNHFLTEDLSRYDVLIFSNVDEIPENGRRKLDHYFQLSRRVLVFPGEDCTPESFNTLWAKGYGFPRWRTTRRGSVDQYLKIGSVDLNHPVFTRLLRKEDGFEYSPEFYTVPGFSLNKRHTALATFEDKTPFMIEVLSGVHRGILIAAAPVAEWSNLPLTGFFPAVLNRLVFYLSQQEITGLKHECGDTLSISPARLNIRGDLVVRTPDNRRIKLPLGMEDPIRFEDTGQAGFYEIFSQGQPITQYVVNIPEEEAEGNFFGVDEFEEILRNYPGRLNVVFSDTGTGLQPLEHSREYSNWLIGLVLILALAETYIGRMNRKTKESLKNG